MRGVTFWRPVAESNRSRRFCRPLTKSLIQPAVARQRTLPFEKAGAKVLLFFELRKFSRIFFANMGKI